MPMRTVPRRFFLRSTDPCSPVGGDVGASADLVGRAKPRQLRAWNSSREDSCHKSPGSSHSWGLFERCSTRSLARCERPGSILTSEQLERFSDSSPVRLAKNRAESELIALWARSSDTSDGTK